MLYVKNRSRHSDRLLTALVGHLRYMARPMRVLLTGGSGFLGSFVAEQLAAEGHVVRALVRPRSERKVLETLPGVEFAPGAIEEPASLLAALAGVDAVVHVAGIVKARKPAEFF